MLAYYEDAYLLFSVPEFSRSLSDNSRSSSKVYAVDPGLFTAFAPASTIDLGQRLETAVFDALRRTVCSVRNGSVSRLLVSEGSRSHEVDFVVGDALLLEPAYLVQVSVGLENAKTRKREIEALEIAMKRFGLEESFIVTMDEEDEFRSSAGVVHIIPAWKYLLA